jgi:hypothetical protein
MASIQKATSSLVVIVLAPCVTRNMDVLLHTLMVALDMERSLVRIMVFMLVYIQTIRKGVVENFFVCLVDDPWYPKVRIDYVHLIWMK